MRIDFTRDELSLLLKMLPCNEATEAGLVWQSTYKKVLAVAERYNAKILPTYTASCRCGGTYRHAPVREKGRYHTVLNFYRCDKCEDVQGPNELDLKKEDSDV